MASTPTLSSTAPLQQQSTQFRWPSALLALACAGVGGFLALHYPVEPWAATAMFALVCVAFFRWPDTWLLVVPALLPIIGFYPWTGWFTFEELDLLVLAAAAGGYARSAMGGTPRQSRKHRTHLISPGSSLLLLLFAISTIVAMWRGFSDAGGFNFGWYQGYHEPLNSLRLAKSFFLALLMLPLWWAAVARRAEQASTWLATGLSLGLAAAALTTIWERLAFVGLFNFSSDYRTTGMFWEMHVGGAALDGFLTLCIAFVVGELFRAKSTRHWVTAIVCAALAAYASLTTFSRGVYLAVPVAVVVTFACCFFARQRQARHTGGHGHDQGTAASGVHLLPAVVLVAVFSASTWWAFPTSGYRGLLALFGVAVLALPLPRLLRSYTSANWVAAALFSALAVAGVLGIAWLVPKGAYIAYALSFGFGAVMLVWAQLQSAQGQPAQVQTTSTQSTTQSKRGRRRNAGTAAQLALPAYLAVLTSACMVALNWGYAKALPPMLVITAVWFAVALFGSTRTRPLWPDNHRWQATTLAAMAMVGGTLAVFGGGAYMSERFSTSSDDFGGRLAHWREGWGMLDAPLDRVLGKGMGRFPSSYFLNGTLTEHPGDYRLKEDANNSYLTLSGGKQRNMGWGELLRVSQRISTPQGGPFKVTLQARAAREVNIHLEVCQKHLLYNGGCLLGSTNMPGKPGEWQTIEVKLAGDPLYPGAWYAPQISVFSVATGTALGVVDIDQINLSGPDGRPLLDNGNFADGMQRWFFSSDRNHMPWHIKSVLMNVLFDQGGIGLALFLSMGVVALWRVVLGNAKDHPLAPGIAGGLIGFMVVGLFDSLLDVPRLAFMFYLVLMLGLTIRHTRPAFTRT